MEFEYWLVGEEPMYQILIVELSKNFIFINPLCSFGSKASGT